MVPRITSKGRSFKGAGDYFLHDLGKATTSERVAFTHTVNMLTDDPEKALKVMAWTASHAQELKQLDGQKLTGRKAENPVYNYVLAWAPDQNPDPSHMIALAEKSLAVLGLADHEALLVAHTDTDHMHLHVIANRVHPVTGLMAKMSKDQLLLSRFAQAYEEEGGKIYCEQRVINNRAREDGRWIKGHAEARQSTTPEYKAKRAARIAAQREAGKLAQRRRAGEEAKRQAARNVQANFDNASAHDDRLYRAREIERPPNQELLQARAAWADERTRQRTGKASGEGAKGQYGLLSGREREEHGATQRQALNDRHTEHRERLHELQAAVRARLETQLARKYAQAEEAVEVRRLAVVEQLESWRTRGLVGRLTGRREELAAQLDVCDRARQGLERQKDQEREALAARHAKHRETQRQHHEQERRVLELKLKAASTDTGKSAQHHDSGASHKATPTKPRRDASRGPSY